MAYIKTENKGEEIHVRLEAESDGSVETPHSSHLFKDAMGFLIEQAPIDYWGKDDGELKPKEFWAAMLGAVARSYVASLDIPLAENTGSPAILRELIDWLEREEYL